MVSINFGDTGHSRQQQALLEAEDRLLKTDPSEYKDIEFHVRQQERRNRVFIVRLRTMHDVVNAKLDRLTYGMGAIGLALLMKGVFTADDLSKFWHFIAHIGG